MGGREARPACGGGERGGPESAHVNRPTSQSLAATRGSGAVQAGNRTLTADGAGAAGAFLGVQVAEAAQAVGELVAGREALARQRLLAGGAHEALAVPGLLPVRDAPAGDGLRAEGRQLPQGPVPGALVPALASGGRAVLAQDTPHRRPGPRGAVLRTARSPRRPFPKLPGPGPRCRPRIPVRDVGTRVSAGTALPPGRQEGEAGRPQLRGRGLMSRSPSSAPPAGRSLQHLSTTRCTCSNSLLSYSGGRKRLNRHRGAGFLGGKNEPRACLPTLSVVLGRFSFFNLTQPWISDEGSVPTPGTGLSSCLFPSPSPH